MAISRVGTASAATASAAATHTAPTVAGVLAGDVIIVATAASLGTLPVWSASSYAGWTLVEDLAETTMLTRVLYRVADGTASDAPPAIATDATANRVSSTAVYRGVDNASPFIAEAGQVHSTASSTSHAAPSITNTDAAAWAVFSGTARQVVTPLTWTAPTGLVEQQDRDNALNTTNNAAILWADSNGAVATGAVTYTGTTSAATAQAIAWAAFLRPATGGGGATTVTPDLASSTATTYAPTLSATVTTTPGLASSAPSAFTPTVSTSVTASPGLASSTPTALAPSVTTTVTVTPGAASSTPTAYAPVVSVSGGPVSVVPGLASSSPTAYAPTVGGTVTVTPNAVAVTSAAYGPTVSSTVTVSPGVASSAPSAYEPAATLADAYHPHVYVTATLAGNGVGTATLAGNGVGAAVLEVPTYATVTVDPAAVTAILAGGGTSTATLASDGVSTATLAEVSETAQLQVV